MKKVFTLGLFLLLFVNFGVFAQENKIPLKDKYNPQKDYFDYSVILSEYPKDYYYTTVKINKSKIVF